MINKCFACFFFSIILFVIVFLYNIRSIQISAFYMLFNTNNHLIIENFSLFLQQKKNYSNSTIKHFFSIFSQSIKCMLRLLWQVKHLWAAHHPHRSQQGAEQQAKVCQERGPQSEVFHNYISSMGNYYCRTHIRIFFIILTIVVWLGFVSTVCCVFELVLSCHGHIAVHSVDSHRLFVHLLGAAGFCHFGDNAAGGIRRYKTLLARQGVELAAVQNIDLWWGQNGAKFTS